MNSVATDPLETLIRDAGEGWLIDWHAPREEALPRLREMLQRADTTASERLGVNAPRLTPEALVEVYARNPHKVRAFLQVMGSCASPHFLLMVWRILQGMGVAAIRMEYNADGPFHLYVRLSSCRADSHHVNGTPDEEYESNDIDDSAILRHLGRIRMGDKGIFDGFYALNLKSER